MPERKQPSESSLVSHIQNTLTLLKELSGEVPVSQLDLEERLGVSGRTLRRYIAALKASGFDIRTRRGQGYQLTFLPGQWQGFLPRTILGQLTTLEVVKDALPLPRVSAEDSLTSLVDSVLRDVSGSVERTAQRLRGAIHWQEAIPRQNATAIAQLQLWLKAIAHLHPLWVKYRDHRGDVTDRQVDPWGCIFTSGTWYGIGYCHLRQDRRNFALERIQSAEMLSNKLYSYPDHFNLSRETAGTWGIWRQEAPQPVEFVVDESLAQFFRECEFPFPNKKRRRKDGRLQVRTSSADLGETARWLAPYAECLDILVPGELKELMVRRSREALARHTG